MLLYKIDGNEILIKVSFRFYQNFIWISFRFARIDE